MNRRANPALRYVSRYSSNPNVLAPMLPTQVYDVVAARALLVNGPSAHEERLVADLLDRRRAAGDTLFSWTYRPGIFRWTGMRSPGRVLDAHFVGDSSAAGVLLRIWRRFSGLEIESRLRPVRRRHELLG